MASIFKQSGSKYWYGRVVINGRTIRESLETTSKSVAERRLKKWVNAKKDQKWGEYGDKSFDDAAIKFTADYMPSLKPSSRKRYDVSIDNLARYFEGVLLKDINHENMFNFEQGRLKEGVSKGTVRRDLSCLSSMYSFCEECQWIKGNPVKAFMRKRAKRGLREAQPRDRYLTHDEELRLIASCKELKNRRGRPHQMLAAMIIFAIDTGLRVEEQLGLTWAQVDLIAERVTVLSNKTKSGIGRAVPLLPRTIKVLNALPRHHRSPYVFHYEVSGARFKSILKIFKRAAEIANVHNIRWHDLRRTCGCRYKQDRKFSLERISAILGHKSITTTERVYAFLNVETIQKEIEDTNNLVHKSGHSIGWIDDATG